MRGYAVVHVAWLMLWVASGACSKAPATTDTPPGQAPAGESPAGETPTPVAPSDEAPAATDTCGEATCAPGQECIAYYGIAGTRGPRFESCEWRCAKDGSCPAGTTCVTVADGPGRVCR